MAKEYLDKSGLSYFWGKIKAKFLQLSGGTMTGRLNLQANQYDDSYSTAALDAKNSNLVGVNSIYTADDADNAQEGFHFYRDTTHVDTVHAHSGKLYFTPNRQLGSAGTSKEVYFVDGAQEFPEAYLKWGGRNFSASYAPIDAAMVSDLGANRFAFLKGSAVTVEYSRDGGSTWSDYGFTDAQKGAIFSVGYSTYIGKADANNKATAHGSDYQLRITVNTGVAPVYSTLNKFVIYVSTNGSTNCKVQIQKALESTPTTFVNHTDPIPIAGWSGYNVINTAGLTTYGNTPASQYGRVRFVFTNGNESASTTYSGLNVMQIMAFGGVGWITPSTMAKTGHLYSMDSSANATFPAQITATQFNGPLNGAATKAYYPIITAGNELRFDVSAKPSGNRLYIGYKWSDGTSDAKIDRYMFYNGGAQLAEVQASTFYGALSGAADTLKTTSVTGETIDSFRGDNLKHAKVTSYSGVGLPSNDGSVLWLPYNGNWGMQLLFDDNSYVIKKRTYGNGTWSAWKDVDTTYSDATTSAAGLMSSSDKTKLNGIATGAEVNQNAFSNVKVGSTTIAADGKTDTLELTAGRLIDLTPDATNDKVTIDCNVSEADTTTSGLMSSTDKVKLNGIATGAEVNQNAFSNVKVGSTTVAADAKTDTLELVAGSNVTLTPDDTNDKVTIAATDTTYSEATTSAAGLMSSSDKTKLNGIATGAEVNQNAFSNVAVGQSTIAADGKTDTLTLAAGSNIKLTADTTNDKVTIAVTDLPTSTFSKVKVGSTTITADDKADTLELESSSGIDLTPDATNDKVTIGVNGSYIDSAFSVRSGAANGICPLDANSKVDSSYLPSYTTLLGSDMFLRKRLSKTGLSASTYYVSHTFSIALTGYTPVSMTMSCNQAACVPASVNIATGQVTYMHRNAPSISGLNIYADVLYIKNEYVTATT